MKVLYINLVIYYLGTNINDEGLIYLSNNLSFLSYLIDLSVAGIYQLTCYFFIGNCFSEASIEKLSDVLSKLRHLQALDISSIYLTYIY